MTGLLTKVLQRYWRITRAATLGAQGVVVDEAGRVLLVRHGYRPGWHFPGGGVEFNETIETALARELLEEAGIVVEAPPKLFGIYANFHAFRGDHIALFIIETWSQPQVPAPSHEIAEHGFFALDALPDDIAAGTRARLDEIFAGARRSSLW